jgi:hypothetical protein
MPESAPVEAPAPAPPRSGNLLWWIIVGAVVLAAVITAGTVIALRPSEPQSVQELAALIVVPPNSSLSQTITSVPPSDATGIRWRASRPWIVGLAQGGTVTLTQYQTADQAAAALDRFVHTSAQHQDIPGRSGAYYLSTPGVPGLPFQAGTAIGRRSTILATAFGTGVDANFIQQLLGQQLDRLP